GGETERNDDEVGVEEFGFGDGGGDSRSTLLSVRNGDQDRHDGLLRGRDRKTRLASSGGFGEGRRGERLGQRVSSYSPYFARNSASRSSRVLFRVSGTKK